MKEQQMYHQIEKERRISEFENEVLIEFQLLLGWILLVGS
ncbi:MAG: hypothetical protein ACI85I_002488 [Arenicella sp.]|jgi:hypothetical protein